MKIKRILLSGTLLALMSGCLLTDELGLKPINSVSGKDLKEAIGSQASLGWFFGCDTFIKELTSGRRACADVGSSVKQDSTGESYPSFTTLFILVKTVTPQNTGLDDDSFYRKASADDCAAQAFDQAFLWTYSYLKESQKTVTINNSQTKESQAASYMPSVLLTSNLAAQCNFDQTGKAVELGPLSL